MATPPRPPDPPKPPQPTPPPRPPSPPPPAQASAPKHEEKHDEKGPAKHNAKSEKHANPSLTPENALALFRNGERIAKQGEPLAKWISMGRLSDGTAVLQMPLTDEVVKEIESGEYYLVEGAKEEESEAPPETRKA